MARVVDILCRVDMSPTIRSVRYYRVVDCVSKMNDIEGRWNTSVSQTSMKPKAYRRGVRYDECLFSMLVEAGLVPDISKKGVVLVFLGALKTKFKAVSN